MYYPELAKVALAYPAIDNHAHPLLAVHNRSAFPIQGVVSEASGDALTRDARYTLAGYRATAQLSKLFGLKTSESTWDAIKDKRDNTDYVDLCNICFKPAGIQCILLDDGLGGVATLAASNGWHDQFTASPCKRIVRIETEAEDVLRDVLDDDAATQSTSIVSVVSTLEELTDKFSARILAHAKDENVAGFKSVVCYRTGLDIAPMANYDEIKDAVLDLVLQHKTSASMRLQQKVLNDYLVRLVLEVAGKYRKPVQFHTGFGDKDIRLAKSSPACMQPLIEAYPNTPIVLLHSGYPHTREAGYLTAVYENVYLDFGNVSPMLSDEGQRAVIRQVLELAPTNKILWSTDGRWWPESYYLASVQARQALYQVLSDAIFKEGLTEQQAIEMVKNALFHNANRLYNLGLEPNMNLL